jgi:hypothetical protein
VRFSPVRQIALLVPSCLLVAGAASAQVPAATARAPEFAKLRSQISMMEGILERAVGEGIRNAMVQMPDLFQGQVWINPPRARGFRIDGYGVFFDVEVPTLPMTTVAISILTRNNEIALVNELNQLRAQMLQAVPEPAKRVELTRTLDRVQSRVSGAPLSEPGVPPQTPGAATPVEHRLGASGATAAPQLAPVRDANTIYTDEVRKALTDVLLEHATQVAPDEWVTIAASESRAGWEPQDTMTLYLSIQGKDLAALRAGKITQEEATKRIVSKLY